MYGTNNIYNLQCVTYNDVTLQKNNRLLTERFSFFLSPNDVFMCV